VEVPHVLGLTSRDVHADDGLAVVGEGHVLDASVDLDRAFVADEVIAEEALAVVADGVEYPDDFATVGHGVLDLVEDHLLPRAKLYGSQLRGYCCLRLVEGLQLLGHARVGHGVKG